MPPAATRRPPTIRSAFTLIEVLIVVTLIGILASATVTSVNLTTEQTRETMFLRSINTFLRAVQLYQTRNLEYPPQADAGVLPTEMRSYLLPEVFEKDTPLGGKWDIEREDAEVTFAVGVDFGTMLAPVDKLETIDRQLDDGDLESGRFRRFTPTAYYFVLDE